MKCNNCGFENKNTAKYCSRCGESLGVPPQSPKANGSNSKIIIAILIVIIVILAAAIGFFVLNGANSSASQSTSQSGSTSSDESAQPTTTESTTPTTTESKDWELIGSYSGSGSGSQSISVPAGQIKIVISAYPIKNYATNHLYVSGSNGESVGVDWGSTSAVETRSNSLTYTSSSAQTFTIDYYETVSWQVEFYRYQ